MKLLLSRFGLGCDASRVGEVYPRNSWGRGKYYSEEGYYGWDRDADWEDELPAFFSMPAISLQTIGPGFIPDYPVFLLFDEFVIDQRTYDLLSNRHHWGYDEYADLVQTLNESGRLTIESYDSLLEPYRDVVQQAVNYDLSNLRSWHRDFEELASRWKRFGEIATQKIIEKRDTGELTDEERAVLNCVKFSQLGMIPTPDGLKILDALKSWNKSLDPYIRKRTRAITGDYFRYITSNILLSKITGAVAHEWFDLEPLYLRKLSVGGHPRSNTLSDMGQARKLFEIGVFEYHPKDSAAFVNLLEDSRVESLRTVVRRATLGEETFDSEFASRTLNEVLKIERAITSKKNVVGWITQPLGFIPWVGSFLQKATEVAAGKMIETRFKKNLDWFFLISSV
jgi:hypothetical protein